MDFRTAVAASVMIAAAGALAGFTFQPGKDKDKPAQPGRDAAKEPVKAGQPSEQEMMEAWMKAATPGEQHKVLNAFTGTWDGTVKHWGAEGAPADESKGTTKSTWVLGDRYLRQEWKGSFMEMPFEGLGYWGYDNAKGQYFSTWMDNMGTGIMVSNGKYDPATKTFTMTGSFTNPVTKKDEKAREVVKIIDDNKHVMEMYGPDPATGKEYKMMEITYTRAGAAAPAGTDRSRGR